MFKMLDHSQKFHKREQLTKPTKLTKLTKLRIRTYPRGQINKSIFLFSCS